MGIELKITTCASEEKQHINKEKFSHLIVSIAHEYKGLGLSMQQLIAIGNAGLVNAFDKMGESPEDEFKEYANWSIHQCMRNALIDHLHQ